MRTRSEQIKATAILSSDWHIRPTVPVCRTDDFITAMWKKVDFILDLAVKHQAPILIAGDLGLRPQWPSWLEEEFIRRVKNAKVMIDIIPGQHDLPDHNLELWRKSSIGVLDAAGAVNVFGEGIIGMGWRDGLMFGFPYGVEMASPMNPKGTMYLIAITHTLVTEKEPEDFLKGAQSAISLLKKFPSYSLILTGDNHKPFVIEHNGRLLVNPGSMMRTSANQVDHKPRVYLWYAQDNHVEPVYLPIEEGVIDRTHIDIQEEKDARIEAYVARLSEEVEIGLDFFSNMELYFRNNRVRKPVQDRVWEAVPK